MPLAVNLFLEAKRSSRTLEVAIGQIMLDSAYGTGLCSLYRTIYLRS